MLRIYRAQMTTFEANAVEQFVERVAGRLARYFPREVAALGDVALRALIRDGIAEAARYGITTRRETSKYITLLLAFGRGFDQAPWAAKILGDAQIPTAFQRVARLYEAGIAAAAGAAS